MEEEEKRRIFHEMMQKCFMKCDRFMIEKWKTTEKPLSQVIEDEVRQNAYHNFYDKVSKAKIASRPTIQKWFGIHGQSMPKKRTDYSSGICLSVFCRRNKRIFYVCHF